MATHTLKIVYDDATGAVAMAHRCTVEVGGHAVGHEREVAAPEGVAASLKAFVDQNRAEVEAEASALAVQHVAAVTKARRPGVKSLTVGGSLGSAGDAATA